MVFEEKSRKIQFQNGKTSFEFLESGDMYQAINEAILINQMLGNNIDGSQNNIWLRVYDGDKLAWAPLLGVRSNSTFAVSDSKATWTGSALDVDYQVTFSLASESTWFWEVSLKSESKKTCDVVYGQDIGVAGKGGVQGNEFYMSQYLGHEIFEGDRGYIVCSRQNQDQGCFPYLQQGSLDTKIVGYSTDATQFLGREYKKTDVPVGLAGDLENRNYQFELSYIALQTEKFNICACCGGRTVTFYGIFHHHHADAITSVEFADELAAAYETFKADSSVPAEIAKPSLKAEFGGVFASEPLTAEEINDLFPERKLEEYLDGDLAAFFTNNHEHIVLVNKELAVERSHGHIITTALDTEKVNWNLITSTNYMYGLFNAQVVTGNTDMNKLLSNNRGFLNTMKYTGQRLWVKIDGTFRILTLPAAYHLGVNFARWYYKIGDDMLVVTSFAAADKPDIILDVKSTNGKEYEFIVTNQLVMGSGEFNNPSNVERCGNVLTITTCEGNYVNTVCPDLHYIMSVQGVDFELGDDAVFFADGKTRNGSLMTLSTKPVSAFKIVIEGHLKNDDDRIITDYCLCKEKEKYNKLYNFLTCGLKVSLENNPSKFDLNKINEIFWWYTHNAMTHFAVPHGLEQPGGAAWGTRDVCQGPFEYLMTTQHYGLVRNVLIEIFCHQYKQNGEWPQWFMFDDYTFQPDDCHGDVVFWPMKALGDYIKTTNDLSILDEVAMYRNLPDGAKIEGATILDHIKLAFENIKSRYLHGMALINYAGGDWDDTLQPANKALKENLVSAWTVALAYQSIRQMGSAIACKDAEFAKTLTDTAAEIKEVFHKYLIKDGVIAGFAYCEDINNIDYMLHPDDKKTGINYRLLPMTRSIIAELVDKEQAERNIALIDEHLACPDGVRLMNRPARYKGGVVEFFQRAEQAANVGREISLQYVHAHIRYIEAMAKSGYAEKAWNAMYTINPINIKDQVPNARIRQSNTYFSSSEGAFDTRYDFQENFEKIRNGSIEAKGGWRIYSSGPGIFLNQVVSNVLGFRLTSDTVIFDPVLLKDLDGLKLDYQYLGKPISIIYHVAEAGVGVNKVCVNSTEVAFTPAENPYRAAGACVAKADFEALLGETNVIDVYLA